MEKKTVEVGFVDFWPGFDPADNFIVAALSERYEVVVSERPQILFFSCFGQRFTGYDCVRVFYTPENLVPDFNVADLRSDSITSISDGAICGIPFTMPMGMMAN